jgi:hypothetical protein
MKDESSNHFHRVCEMTGIRGNSARIALLARLVDDMP